ncbi:MAG: Lrp/AsnC family transcriptional regulator [Gammaproteobacteria bacterium]
MDETDRRIINALQDGFPIAPDPYRKAAERLKLTESDLIARLEKLLEKGFLTRFGPMYHAERMGGALTLAAVKAPEDRYDEIAELINTFPEVAHNYARDHALNMWFVIATESPERIRRIIEAIEAETGLKVYNMPKQTEYFVGLKFDAS